jgi:hypothetical protein
MAGRRVNSHAAAGSFGVIERSTKDSPRTPARPVVRERRRRATRARWMIDRTPSDRVVRQHCGARSQFLHPELATIAAVVKIPQFPDWQPPGLWEIIDRSRLLRREDFYNQCDSGILSAGRQSN